MTNFVQGQRWVADSEPELGLGMVVDVTARTVNIFFEIGDCERCYATNQAPLTRIAYTPEDQVQTADGIEFIVSQVHEQGGLIIYETTEGDLVPETRLSSSVKLNQPFMRLMTGQLDSPKWFHFKRQLDAEITRYWQSQKAGLLGVRAELIPHQLYVAWAACQHQNVRVLLADEVGLGKTIEACMIVSRLVRQERAERVLILVPDALQVQWLVELVRRFSLKPELYAGAKHDFASGQIHIVPHSALTETITADFEFDTVVVDEVHNIQHSSAHFQILQIHSTQSKNLVLLSATPEQLGVESHFERLKLLDPIKFSSLDAFLEQESHYEKLNHDIKNLGENREKLISEYDLTPSDEDNQLISQLLDHHGIGRSMFRNVRQAISGFANRQLHAHTLDEGEWEAKFEWLANWILENEHKKVLVIMHQAEQVFNCESHLWAKHGIDAAVFHEGQTLVERDRAAAYFADLENGSKVLICSEIGSEGRNFQFCNQLVCLDLPANPDMLEQRIGRLDRIGQKQTVNIHVPFVVDSQTEKQFIWYHDVLQCIEQSNPAAGALHEEFWSTYDPNDAALENEIAQKRDRLKAEIESGRDALLELNSCRQPLANQLKGDIEAFEQNTPEKLVEMAADLLQFHYEETNEGAFNLTPSDKMLVPALPGIPPDGAEITYSRTLANQREDYLFITWDSPFIQGLWELLHHSELGSASVATLPSRQLPAGHCLLEACFDVVTQSKNAAQCREFFESLSLRSVVLDISDNDLSQALSEHSFQASLQSVKKYLAREIIQSKKDEIPDWYKKAEAFAEKQLIAAKEQALKQANTYYSTEITRIEKLAQSRSAADLQGAELESTKQLKANIINGIEEHTLLRLSAVRLIVITEP